MEDRTEAKSVVNESEHERFAKKYKTIALSQRV